MLQGRVAGEAGAEEETAEDAAQVQGAAPAEVMGRARNLQAKAPSREVKAAAQVRAQVQKGQARVSQVRTPHER